MAFTKVFHLVYPGMAIASKITKHILSKHKSVPIRGPRVQLSSSLGEIPKPALEAFAKFVNVPSQLSVLIYVKALDAEAQGETCK